MNIILVLTFKATPPPIFWTRIVQDHLKNWIENDSVILFRDAKLLQFSVEWRLTWLGKLIFGYPLHHCRYFSKYFWNSNVFLCLIIPRCWIFFVMNCWSVLWLNLILPKNFLDFDICMHTYLYILARFVRFVSTPAVLERFVSIEKEILQIESSVQANESNIHVSGQSVEGMLWT